MPLILCIQFSTNRSEAKIDFTQPLTLKATEPPSNFLPSLARILASMKGRSDRKSFQPR